MASCRKSISQDCFPHLPGRLFSRGNPAKCMCPAGSRFGPAGLSVWGTRDCWAVMKSATCTVKCPNGGNHVIVWLKLRKVSERRCRFHVALSFERVALFVGEMILFRRQKPCFFTDQNGAFPRQGWDNNVVHIVKSDQYIQVQECITATSQSSNTFA